MREFVARRGSNVHEPDYAAGKSGLNAGHDRIDGRDGPQILPGRGPLASELNGDGDGGGAEVEYGVDDQGPEQSEAPGVVDGVEGKLGPLGRPAQRWEGRALVPGRRVAQTCRALDSDGRVNCRAAWR